MLPRQSGRVRAAPQRFGTLKLADASRKKSKHDESKLKKKDIRIKRKKQRQEASKKVAERKRRKRQITKEQTGYKYVRLDREHTATRLALANDFFTVNGFTGYRLKVHARC